MSLVPRRVRPDVWSPVGVADLESNAFDVVRSKDHRSVIAGPGAGKTELLAQRAAYLLQTELSQAPQRILAISFKRDAAVNLGARVAKRCHPDHAARFDSLTFDAFAKGLVDRFGQALPARWRPRGDYEIAQEDDRVYRTFLERLGAPPVVVGRRDDIEELSAAELRRQLLGGPLPIDGWRDPTPVEWAAERFWTSWLHEANTTYLSFPMIGRLAELLLRVNPQATTALTLTYSHVFLDEFQDTTQVQYDLVRTIFLGSATVITAVGDNKQQIMRWAHAMADPFGAFENDFGATRTRLLNNYRSSPELVRIQHVLAQALDAGALQATSKSARTIDGDSCEIWDFSSSQKEAQRLSAFVANQLTTQNLTPRDLVLLVRQKAGDYARVLSPAFAAQGLQLRNEAAQVGKVMLQDLLAEEVSDVVLRLLRLAMSGRAGRHWTECQQVLMALRASASDDDAVHARMSKELDAFARKLHVAYGEPVHDEDRARMLVATVLDFVGRDRLVAAHARYRQGDWFEKVIEAAALHLAASSADASNWTEALDAYEGMHAVPLMTIHKSKGLEYHTVIFIGLDDDAWWSFDRDQVEATAGFFVAFTRARQRVVFTYCARRGNRTRIDALYRLLRMAGVQTVQMD